MSSVDVTDIQHPLADQPILVQWVPPTLQKTLDVPCNDVGLRLLALQVRRVHSGASRCHPTQGCWRAVIDKVKAATPADPEEMLRLTTYKVLALCKLRMYSAAFDELNTLGGLDSPQYQRDTPSGPVSLVPFAMRWISAQLPGLLGRAAYAVDELYKLAAQCQQHGDGTDRRTRLVLFTLVNYHVRYDMCSILCQLPTMLRTSTCVGDDAYSGSCCFVIDTATILSTYRSKEYVCALQLCNQLLIATPDDPDVLSKVAYIQLLMGDIAAAAKTVDLVGAMGIRCCHSFCVHFLLMMRRLS